MCAYYNFESLTLYVTKAYVLWWILNKISTLVTPTRTGLTRWQTALRQVLHDLPPAPPWPLLASCSRPSGPPTQKSGSPKSKRSSPPEVSRPKDPLGLCNQLTQSQVRHGSQGPPTQAPGREPLRYPHGRINQTYRNLGTT